MKLFPSPRVLTASVGLLALASIPLSRAHAQVHVQLEPGAQSDVQVDSHPVRIQFLNPDPDAVLQLHRTVASAWAVGAGGAAYGRQYQPVCVAPCTATMRSGGYSFAVSRNGGGEVPVTPPIVNLQSDSTLIGYYQDNSDVRLGGWLFMLGGLLGGLGLSTGGLLLALDGSSDSFGGSNDDATIGWTLFGLGLGLTLVSELVGLILLGQPDQAELRVE